MKRLSLVILFLIIVPAALSFAQVDDVPQEYVVKAKYLLNIPSFTEMPPQAKATNSYTICLIGETPLESVLASFSGKQIKNLPLVIRKVKYFSQIDSCQMIFIAPTERHRLQHLLPEANRHGILTVSDMRDFARLGGIIGLQNVDNRITFDVNLSSAKKASISFSSNLLKLARDIIN